MCCYSINWYFFDVFVSNSWYWYLLILLMTLMILIDPVIIDDYWWWLMTLLLILFVLVLMIDDDGIRWPVSDGNYSLTCVWYYYFHMRTAMTSIPETTLPVMMTLLHCWWFGWWWLMTYSNTLHYYYYSPTWWLLHFILAYWPTHSIPWPDVICYSIPAVLLTLTLSGVVLLMMCVWYWYSRVFIPDILTTIPVIIMCIIIPFVYYWWRWHSPFDIYRWVPWRTVLLILNVLTFTTCSITIVTWWWRYAGIVGSVVVTLMLLIIVDTIPIIVPLVLMTFHGRADCCWLMTGIDDRIIGNFDVPATSQFDHC